MLQQQEANPANEQERTVENTPTSPVYLGSVHQVYPERHFALLRIIGPMPQDGAVLISHPFDGSSDRMGNLCVASGQHSRNGIIAADIRSGIVMKGDRIFQYRNISQEANHIASDETETGETLVYEGLEQDVVLPEENTGSDTPDYGVSRFHAATRRPEPAQEEQAAPFIPRPQEVEPTEQEKDDTIIDYVAPPAPSSTPGLRLEDIPDTIDGWDNM